MEDRFTEQDWRLFRAKLPGWQEAYMEERNREYIELLQAEGSASAKFWALDRRIREDKRSAGVQLEMRRSRLLSNVARLLVEDAITLADLAEFSSDFQAAIKMLANLPLESAAQEHEA